MNKPILIEFGNETNIAQPIEKVVSGKDFVSFGEDNRFPEYLLECYNECTLLQSCVNTLTDYVSGNGLTDETIEKTIINKKGMTLMQLLKKITFDYIIFGAFSLNILRDTYGKISEIYYLDVKNCRLSEDEKYIYYNSKWSKFSKTVKKYDSYTYNRKSVNAIYYFKSPKSRNVYGLPLYSSALKDIQCLIEISNFHLGNIKNNFMASGLISFNNGTPSEEQQHEIENKINEKFSGSRNGGKLLITFSDSAEQAPVFSRMQDDNYDQKFIQLQKSSQNNLLASFRCSSQLLGINPENTSFNSIEYENAFAIFKSIVVSPIQREIEDAFAEIDYDYQPEFKEFKVEFNDNQTL